MPRKHACKARLHQFASFWGPHNPWWYATEDGCRHRGRVLLDDNGRQFWASRARLVKWLRGRGYEVIGYGVTANG